MEKIMGQEFLADKQIRNWVETKNCGLKIDEFSASWTY